jgi:hypothetical protein
VARGIAGSGDGVATTGAADTIRLARLPAHVRVELPR